MDRGADVPDDGATGIALSHAYFDAGRLGTTSDVLGFDDDLPDTFRGLPTRFAFTGESDVRCR